MLDDFGMHKIIQATEICIHWKWDVTSRVEAKNRVMEDNSSQNKHRHIFVLIKEYRSDDVVRMYMF